MQGARRNLDKSGDKLGRLGRISAIGAERV